MRAAALAPAPARGQALALTCFGVCVSSGAQVRHLAKQTCQVNKCPTAVANATAAAAVAAPFALATPRPAAPDGFPFLC